MPGDTGPVKQQGQTVRVREEISECMDSAPGKPVPVVTDTGETKDRKQRVSWVLYYTMGTSMLCVGAVMIDPNRVVEGMALATLASSFGFAKFLVAGTRKKSKPASDR